MDPYNTPNAVTFTIIRRLQNILRIGHNHSNIRRLPEALFLFRRLMWIGIKPSRKGVKSALDSDNPEIQISLPYCRPFSTCRMCGHRASNKTYQIARIFAINGLYIINRIRCRSPIGSSSKVAVSLGQAFMSWPPHSISIYKKRPKYFLASS